MENINIAELLKGCPQGMELNCTLFDNVTFVEVDTERDFPIEIKVDSNYKYYLTKEGCYHKPDFNPSAKCVIFPKGKTTWEGFVPPCEFKDGDIIFTHADCLKVGVGNTWISIFQEKRNSGVATYVDYAEDGSDIYLYNEDKALLCMEKDILRQRLATEEEKQKLFQAIKDNGYMWDDETKTLAKLIKPWFKVGDKIQHKNGHSLGVSILKVNADCYTVKDFMGDQITIDFTHQDNYELVHNKFDINTLTPFESRVLVRDYDDDKWQPGIWGFYDKGATSYPYKLIGDIVRYCIPYEGNEHLLGKTDDCDNFYKTWE